MPGFGTGGLSSFGARWSGGGIGRGAFATTRETDGAARPHASVLDASTTGDHGDVLKPAERDGAPQALTIPSDPGATTVLAIGGSQTGVVDFLLDHDLYRVSLVAGQHYVFTMTGNGGSPLVDAYLELYDSQGTLIALDDDAGVNREALLRFTATTTGTFYLNAKAYDPGDTEPDPDLVGGYTVSAAIGAAQNPLDTINLGFTVSQQNITVFFAPVGHTNPLDDTALRAWTQPEIDAAFAAFATFAAVTNLSFTRVFVEPGARFVMALIDLEPGTLGYFATTGGVGYGAFDPAGTGWANGLSPGGLGFVTLIHEIGHGLGLAHPHDNGGNSEIMQGVVGEFDSYGTFELNQGVYTTMTYNDGFPFQGGVAVNTEIYGSQSTPMPLDIGLLQQKYVANSTTNGGANTYTLPDQGALGTSFVGIWDTGGIDEIVYNGSRIVTIDLRPATLLNAIGGGGFVSSTRNVPGGFVIAAGVMIENASGGAESDFLTGNDGANVLTGNGGADTLRGGLGDDTLIGGDDDDILDDTQGLNSYDGGAGNDFASISLASRTGALSYSIGNPSILENGVALVTFASIERVSIVGGSGADSFTGGALNDVLDGGPGADTLIGGAGDDTYSVDSAGDVVTELANQGNDTLRTTITNVAIVSHPNFENLTYLGSSSFIGQGDSGVNIIIGGPGNDYVYAYDNDDTVRGGAGVDVFIMGNGNDTVFGGADTDYIYGGAGTDIMYGEGGVDVILAGEGDDFLYGGPEGDYFYGEDGDDTAFGDGSTVFGDGLGAASGNDIFVMGSGNDTASGGDGQDYFYMGDGNDTLSGGAGVDVMLGEAGDDLFIPGLGVDYVFMGTGNDTLNVNKTSSGVTVLNDFTAGFASGDLINLSGTSWSSFAEIQANISDFTASGGFCILTLDADTSIWFIGVAPNQLTAGDFIFGGG